MAAVYNPFKSSSSLDLEAKKRLSEAPKRKSHVRTASLAGDVQAVLSFLETIADPLEAAELALDAHKYLTNCRHVAAVQRLERECDGLFRKKDDISSSADDAPAAPVPKGPDYDHNTAQIKTGKIGSMMLHIERGINLPIKDGTAASSDPFVRIQLWEGTGEMGRRCLTDKTTMTKMMNLNPVWNEHFVIDVHSPDTELDLSVYDFDEDGTHDLMGKVIVPLRESINDFIQQRENTYRANLEVARIVAQTAGSKNIVGRSLGGTPVTAVNDIYGADTTFGRVGWNAATGIKALSSGVQRSSEQPQLLPKLYHSNLKSVSGLDSKEGGALVFTTTFVPAVRPKTIANVPMFPRKTLEHITPMTPASKLVFEDIEFLQSSVVQDATWDKSRTLTTDVMWPKEVPITTSCGDTSLRMQRSLTHLTWRNLIEPTRPYKQPLPSGVCKDPKTGLDDIEEQAAKLRSHNLDSAMRQADQLWGGQSWGTGPKGSLKERLAAAASKAIDARAHRTRSNASEAIRKGKAQYEEYKYRDAERQFEDALRIASDG